MNTPLFRLLAIRALRLSGASALLGLSLSPLLVRADSATIEPTTWYYSGPSSAVTSGEDGLTFTTKATADYPTSIRHVLTYFTSTTLANSGDSLSVSLTFSGQLNNPTNYAFNFAFYDSGGSQIPENGLGQGSGSSSPFFNYTGYRVGIRAQASTTTQPFELRTRSVANAVLGSTSAHTGETAGGPASSTALTSGASYNITYTITRIDPANLGISISVTGAGLGDNYNGSWTVASTYTTFDTFAITIGGASAFDSITLSDVVITTTAIPEPSTVSVLLGAGGLIAALVFRRRR
ncbi:anchor protein [Opitutaceae bacterium TAV5]|nr:anchor protein [Opitutaceae bacterium TAV5]